IDLPRVNCGLTMMVVFACCPKRNKASCRDNAGRLNSSDTGATACACPHAGAVKANAPATNIDNHRGVGDGVDENKVSAGLADNLEGMTNEEKVEPEAKVFNLS